MMTSVDLAKQERMEVRMEVLTELQVTGGFGFFLQVLQALWMRVRALTTLERLWHPSNRLETRSEVGLTGVEVMRLMERDGVESDRSAELALTGHELLGRGRKLPCNQKSELT